MQPADAASMPRWRTRLPLLALLVAGAVSLTGNMFAAVAIPWFVLETTGSAAQTGLAAFFNTLPLIIAAFFGGALVDRVGYRRASIAADLLSGLAVALIPLLAATVGLPFWGLLGLIFLGALLDTPGAAARHALAPAIAAYAGVRLERVNAASVAVFRGSILAGPPLAGALIAAYGPTVAFWIDAASFACSALLVGAGVPALLAPRPPGGTRYLADLRRGLEVIRGDRLLRSLLITPALLDTLLNPLFMVVLPVYLKRMAGALDFGLLLAALGGGQLLGTLLYGAVLYRRDPYTLAVGGFLGVALVIAPVALLPPLPLLLGLVFLAGLLMGPIAPIFQTASQRRAPPAMLARISGTSQGLRLMLLPPAMAIVGLAVERYGVQPCAVGIAAGTLVAAGAAFFNPGLHELRYREAREQ